MEQASIEVRLKLQSTADSEFCDLKEYAKDQFKSLLSRQLQWTPQRGEILNQIEFRSSKDKNEKTFPDRKESSSLENST